MKTTPLSDRVSEITSSKIDSVLQEINKDIDVMD